MAVGGCGLLGDELGEVEVPDFAGLVIQMADALRQMCVKGNNSCKRCGRRSVIKHPKLAVAAILAQQDMAAVRPVGDKCCRR